MCHAMDGGLGGCLVGCMVTGLVLYGCGPNIAVGLPASVICGSLAAVDKVKAYMLTQELGKVDTAEEKLLANSKIIKLDDSASKHMRHCKAWAVGMIPIIGGFCAIAVLE
jgi:hypothetical protein